MQAALWAMCAAARALMGTAPTTYTGLRALEDYLNDDPNKFDRLHQARQRRITGSPTRWAVGRLVDC